MPKLSASAFFFKHKNFGCMNKRIFLNTLVTLSLSVSITLMSLSARALPFGNPAPLEEIVVIADRVETSLKDSTYSVDKIQSHDRQYAVTAFASDALFSSHAWISPGSGQEHLTAIRSPVFTGAGSCSNFLVTEDGIATRAPGFCNVNQLLDVFYETAEGIEVYRGPASAARGGSALFGGVDFYTPRFHASDRKAKDSRLNINVGENDYYSASWVLMDNLLASIEAEVPQQSNHMTFGQVTKNNGFRQASGTDQQKIGYKYRHSLGHWQVVHSVLLNNLEQETAGFIEGFEAYRNAGLRKSNPSPEAYRDAKSARFYSRFDKQGAKSSINITPYFRWHKMAFLMHFLPWQPTEENGHRSVGVTSNWHYTLTENLQLTTSADLDITRGFLSETQTEESPIRPDRFPRGIHYDYEVDAFRYALSSRLDASLSKNLLVSATTRFDSVEYDYNTLEAAGSDCAEGVTGCRFFRPDDTTSRYQNISWRLAARYALTSRLNVYITHASAFRAPHTSELYRLQNSAISSLNEVQLKGSELGLRYASPAMAGHIALFSQRQKEGIYQNSERQYLLGVDTKHEGVEVSVRVKPVANVEAILLARYENHRYQNSPEVLGISTDIRGNTIDTAPKRSHKAILNWHLNAGKQLTLRINKQASYYLNPENTARYSGHMLVDIGYTQNITDSITWRLDINNVANRDYATRADIAFGNYRYFPGDGRLVRTGVTFTL